MTETLSSPMYSPDYRQQHVQQKVAAIQKAMNKYGTNAPLSKMKVDIVTAGDKKVCEACKAARSKGTPLPPDHPHCRCRLIRG